MNNNFFSDDGGDHTQIFPMPGGNKNDVQKLLQNEQQQRQQSLSPDEFGHFGKKNNQKESRSLVDAATNLLILIAHISNTLDARDTVELKQLVIQEINLFIQKTKRLGIDDKTKTDATYILCTAIDEAVLNTPWGRQSGWSVNTLLSSYFQDVVGGQIFFEKLRDHADDPVRSHQLLKLMYYCLALGYQGRYRTESDSIGKLTKVRQWLAEKIRYASSDNTSDLSPHWIGIRGLKFSLRDYISGWLIAGVVALLLAGVFTYFLTHLNVSAATVNEQLVKLDITTVERPKPKKIFIPPPPKEELTIAEKLGDGSGFIINESLSKTTLLIPGDILFASGSTKVTDVLKSSLNKLGNVLNEYDGRLRIIGHSDNVPLSFRLKQRYGSNLGLSQQRAEAVATVLKITLEDASRIETFGKGANVPLAENKTKDGRAKNRRVEIEVLH